MEFSLTANCFSAPAKVRNRSTSTKPLTLLHTSAYRRDLSHGQRCQHKLSGFPKNCTGVPMFCLNASPSAQKARNPARI